MLMPPAPPISVNWSVPGSTRQILPNPPEHSSSALGWSVAQLQLHSQPAFECPEHTFQQHVVALHHYPHPARSERAFAGRQQSETLNDGDIVLIPAGVPHANRWDQPGRFSAVIFEPARLAALLPEANQSLELLPQFTFWDPLVRQLILALEQQVLTAQSGSSLYADSLSTALAAHLLTHYSPRAKAEPEPPSCPTRIRRATAFIEDNFQRNLTLAEIASAAHSSQFHFARLFRKATGLSPYQFLLRCRIDRAAALLRTTDLSIDEIAFRVGFGSASQLSAHFRRRTGATPAAFRHATR